MPRLLFTLVFFIAAISAKAQRLTKYPIGNSGCNVYMFCNPGEFKLKLSEDSSKIYTAECNIEGVTYGVICVKLLAATDDLAAAEDLVVAYLDFLKSSFEISKAVGYGRGNRLNNNENTRGVIDYWEDSQKQSWKIKGWTDGGFIGVLYSYSKTELPTKADVFLNSFRLPGM